MCFIDAGIIQITDVYTIITDLDRLSINSLIINVN